ncbi:uncharacterized protein LOC121645567 [Melanotaenia boesemani]|uniref:uncharacterized protein LOC121645567 n=1 Tax=Melanotaenia boesemani TaxID=1250792 RepID=UPI001C053593|nr:uncharacterized protein LOC121645567 [Melanotaenia boesemani]
MFTLCNMLKMKADKWIFLFALWLKCLSSNSEHFNERPCESFCETSELIVTLGSSVLLPCIFSTNSNNRVNWIHNGEDDLVNISSSGKVTFPNPRHGRVKVFPVQTSEGNYSICIDDLKKSDLGCYLCKQTDDCFQVELLRGKTGTLTEEMQQIIFICTGVTALILLSIGGYFCGVNCIRHCNKTTQDNLANVNAVTEDARARSTAVVNAQPQEARMPVQEHQMDVHNSDLVYENDYPYPVNGDININHGGLPGHLQNPSGTQPGQSTSGIYPNLEEFRCQRVQSQRTRQRFHIELFSRLRQSSLSRHFYVNQGELRKQAMAAQKENQRAGMGRKKAKDNCDYKNPIYNRSTDQLNQL